MANKYIKEITKLEKQKKLKLLRRRLIMNNFVENYKKVDIEVRQRISRDMVNVIGLDNLLYGVIHAMVCDCIDNNIPTNERRKLIINKVNSELNKWID